MQRRRRRRTVQNETAKLLIERANPENLNRGVVRNATKHKPKIMRTHDLVVERHEQNVTKKCSDIPRGSLRWRQGIEWSKRDRAASMADGAGHEPGRGGSRQAAGMSGENSARGENETEGGVGSDELWARLLGRLIVRGLKRLPCPFAQSALAVPVFQVCCA